MTRRAVALAAVLVAAPWVWAATTRTTTLYLPAAGCRDTTPGAFFSLPTTAPPGVECVAEREGILAFADAANEAAVTTFRLPATWQAGSGITVSYAWRTGTTTGAVVWCTELACVAGDEPVNPAWPGLTTSTCVSDSAGDVGTAEDVNLATDTGITITGCDPGELVMVRVSRDGAGTTGLTDTVTQDADLISLELTLVDSGVSALGALADHGDLCAANQGVARNATDDANVCITPLTAEVDGSTTNEIEVVDEAYSAGNFDGGTTQAVSQDDLYDLIHAGDSDDDGRPDILDTTSNGFVKTTGGTGAITIDTSTYLTAEVDGSTTNEIQSLFATIDASSGTDPVADTSTDTLVLTGTAPIVATGDSGADSVTLSLTQNAGTDVTADLEEETHASEHSLGGGDAITATNLASACTNAQVLGGTGAGTGVECQTDDDVPGTGAVTDAMLATAPFHTVEEADVAESTATTTMDFDGTDFDVSCATGECDVALSNQVVMEGGGQIGGATDFEATVDLATKTLITPAATGDRSSTCTAGALYTETDDTTTTATGASICQATNTQVWIGDIVSGGLSGGQTIAGGTGVNDDLTLNPTSNTDPSSTSLIALCSDTDSVGCLSLFPNGLSHGTDIIVPVFASSTFTQTVDSGAFGGILPLATVFADQHIDSIADDAINGTALGQTISFLAKVTTRNATNDNYGGKSVIGFRANPLVSRTGSGMLTVAETVGFQSVIQAPAASITLTNAYGFRADDLDADPAGTATDIYGMHVKALTRGTNLHPFSAGEHTITGSTKSGEGDWGVETGAPDRFYYRNESQHIWRMGYATFTGGIFSTAGNGLAADNTTRWVSAITVQTAAACTTNDDSCDSPVSGALTAYKLTCGLSAAPGTGGDSRTITLYDDGATTALACTMTDTALSCTDIEDGGITLAAGSLISLQSTAANTPANAADVTCTIFYNVAAF